MKRYFHTNAIIRGNVRTKIEILKETNNVSILTRQEIERQRQKQLKKAKLMRLKPHSKHKLEGFLGKTLVDEDAAKGDLTPTLSLVLKSADYRMLYAYLGTSGQQLKDSFVVERDVLKFLRLGHDIKAILLCKLAKENGVVGLNRVLEYYLERGEFSLAFKSINNRKKWGIPLNDYTYTILFKGCRQSKTLLTEDHVNQVYSIYQSLVESSKSRKTQLSIIHINSALGALLNTKFEHMDKAWSVFTGLPSAGSHAPNEVTYSILTQSLRKIDADQSEFVQEKYKALTQRFYKTIVSQQTSNYRGRKLKLDNVLLTSLAATAFRTKSKAVALDTVRFICHYLVNGDFDDLIENEDYSTTDPHLKQVLELRPRVHLQLRASLCHTLFPLFARLSTVDLNTVIEKILAINPSLIDERLILTWYGVMKNRVPEATAGDAMVEQLQIIDSVFEKSGVSLPVSEDMTLLKYIYSSFSKQHENIKAKNYDRELNRKYFESIYKVSQLSFIPWRPTDSPETFRRYLTIITLVPTSRQERELLFEQFKQFMASLDLEWWASKKPAWSVLSDMRKILLLMISQYNQHSRMYYSVGDKLYEKYNQMERSLLEAAKIAKTMDHSKIYRTERNREAKK